MSFFERVTDGVGLLLDRTEDRNSAWLLAAGGLVVTAFCWYAVLGVPELMEELYGLPGPAEDDLSRRPSRLVGMLTGVVTVGAPFIAIQAIATLVSREEQNPAPSDRVFSFEARNRGDRQRRVRLAAAIAGVVNLALLMFARQ